MAYPLRNHQLYNMVLLHPSRGDVEESWTSTGPRKYMDDFYAEWSPSVRKLLSLVDDDEIPEWNLKIHKPLASWVEGNVALMGDACHPTLPYVAQGAAQAVEDAGVLAAVLSMTTKMEESENSRWLNRYPANFAAQSTPLCWFTARFGNSAQKPSCILRTKRRHVPRKSNSRGTGLMVDIISGQPSLARWS